MSQTTYTIAHFRVYSLPGSRVLVLGPGQHLPAHISADTALLAWAGHATSLLAALEAAF